MADSSSSSSSGSSKPCLIPKHVQIVDVENHTDALRPYNEYVIVVKKGDGGELVKGHWWRSIQEFCCGHCNMKWQPLFCVIYNTNQFDWSTSNAFDCMQLTPLITDILVLRTCPKCPLFRYINTFLSSVGALSSVCYSIDIHY